MPIPTLIVITTYSEQYMYHSKSTKSKPASANSNSYLQDIVLEVNEKNIIFKRVKDLFISEHRLKSMEKSSESDAYVALATQTSFEKLHFLETLSERWNGPISEAVYIDKEYSNLIRYIEYFYQCFPSIKANTSFHLVYPANLELSFSVINCDLFRMQLQSSTFHKETVRGHKHPFNILRNMAIPREQDGFIFLLDVDLVPSKNLHDEFLRFAHSTLESVLDSSIFIVPSFESNNSKVLPDNKKDLLRGLYTKDIQVFYIKDCPYCQFNTNYRKWKYTRTSSPLSTYKITTKFYQYQPFYIVKRNNFIPCDERFIGRGYDIISQVCEVWKADFQFLVLSDVFVVHRGFNENFKPEEKVCIARYNTKNPRKKERDVFWRLLKEIDHKRHAKSKILKGLELDLLSSILKRMKILEDKIQINNCFGSLLRSWNRNIIQLRGR